jgi:hypothetical protein
MSWSNSLIVTGPAMMPSSLLLILRPDLMYVAGGKEVRTEHFGAAGGKQSA